MLRQLARLTRPMRAAGPDALAVAVYGDALDRHVDAKESGYEGVACVDDAARLLDVLCDVWLRTRLPAIERWARGLLDFVLWMQTDDGRWVNFVYGWDGEQNHEGLTSVRGENFWHARALLGLSNAWIVLKDERAERALSAGFAHAAAKPAPADVRAVHMEVARRLIRTGSTKLVPVLDGWAQELVACRTDDVLMNSLEETGVPHLWAHIQEGVLADAGILLGDPRLVDVAAESARAVLVPAVEGGFDRPSVSPYDVSSTIFSMDRLARARDDGGWSSLAEDARDWFSGRNTAGAPVYDEGRGRVADGVDEGRLNRNSGAESNIVAAEVLMEAAMRSAAEVELPGA
ncbi:MAG: hypothetical protein U0V56_07025 [Actinomycetota bacterium]